MPAGFRTVKSKYRIEIRQATKEKRFPKEQGLKEQGRPLH